MSSKRAEATRQALLEAAWELLQASQSVDLPMAEVAARAGVSRQALYLHFGTRAGLLVALTAWLDGRLGLDELLEDVRRAEDPATALLQSLRVTARYAPRIDRLAVILDHARATDPAAEAAWADRMALRLARLRELISEVAAAGRLRDGWTVDTAADALWALSVPRTYHDLVVVRGWTVDAYEALLVSLGERLVLADDARRPSGRR